jgi:hypothetical protein
VVKMGAPCLCNDGWFCEQHPTQGWPHGKCAGPGIPCPVCNTGSPPRLPADWESKAKIE